MDRTGIYLAAYRMTDLGWTPQQVEEDFHKHHQKKWWPIFLKYKRVAVQYAQTHKQNQKEPAQHSLDEK